MKPTFLQSSPDYTVTAPGDTEDAMTVTAYQHRDNSLSFRQAVDTMQKIS